MSSTRWWVVNGRARAPPGVTCSIGVSTSTKPRSSRRSRNACSTLARAAMTSRDSGSAVSWRYRRRTLRSGSLMPCHFSGGGSSDFDSSTRFETFSDSSPRFVFTTSPAAPTMSNRSTSSRSAQSCAGMAFSAMNSWMSPDRSRSCANATLPWRRSSTMRPATDRAAPVPAPGSMSPNSARTSAASASFEYVSANGSTPRARRRWTVSRRCCAISSPRP